jgi:hypothetical protein
MENSRLQDAASTSRPSGWPCGRMMAIRPNINPRTVSFMAEERVKRKLAAILAADVVGYSRLMGADEAGKKRNKLAPPHRFPPCRDVVLPCRLAFSRCVQAIAGGVLTHPRRGPAHRRQHRQAAKHSCAPSINVKHKVDLHLPHSARCLNVIRFGEAREHAAILLSSVRSDQDFPDNIGSDVSDLTAAHAIAMRLMKRVMMVSSFADCAPDLRRWTVKVADERGRRFHRDVPNIFRPQRMEAFSSQWCPGLLLRLDAMNAVDDMSRVRVPAPPPGGFRGAITNSCQTGKGGGGPLGGRPQ